MITYQKGDATAPKSKGNKIIVHICNDQGGWGKGFVLAISKRWKKPELEYRKWFACKENFELGKIQFIQVEDDLWIANLIGQHKIRKDKFGNPPIRYESIKLGMNTLVKKAQSINASVHMPRIGCGLAEGKWERIEPILNNTLIANNIETVVYDY